MHFAADLHLHSRFASGVSPAMTIENIALWAQRKGVDLLGTGDCLQPQWLAEIEASMIEAEPGFLALKPEIERAVHARLPEHLRRSLRFVLSTEVNCVPQGTKEINGLHQLIYFPSLSVVHEFAVRIGKRGNLQEGRPVLELSARQLVQGAKNFNRVHVAAPHVMNPWFSVLGVVGGALSMDEIYGDSLPDLWAVETGLTSNPDMCGRVPSLSRLGLYSCSDAHSLENIGRECTLVDIQPNYDSLMDALRHGNRPHGFEQTYKFPIELTRYYLNWCSGCKTPFDAWPACPECGRQLTMGSRDRLEQMASRGEKPAALPLERPPFRELHPLAYLIAKAEGKKPESIAVRRAAGETVDRLGNERAVLTQIPLSELLTVTPVEVAQAILRQRENSVRLELGQAGFVF
jgi:PHP family Zn ribbon phosphoesterase